MSFYNFKYRQRRSGRNALLEYFEHFSNKWTIVFRFVWDSWAKSFLVKHGKKIINKFLKGIKKTHRVDQKLTFQKLKISMQDYEKLTNNNMLTETARDFFHLLESFGKNKNIKKFVNV